MKTYPQSLLLLATTPQLQRRYCKEGLGDGGVVFAFVEAANREEIALLVVVLLLDANGTGSLGAMASGEKGRRYFSCQRTLRYGFGVPTRPTAAFKVRGADDVQAAGEVELCD